MLLRTRIPADRVPVHRPGIYVAQVNMTTEKWVEQHYVHLKAIVDAAVFKPGLDKIVCFGLGSLSWDQRFLEIPGEPGLEYDFHYATSLLLLRPNFIHHVVVTQLAKMLRAKLGRPIRVYAHDPGYNGVDLQLVRGLFGMNVLRGGHLALGDEKALALVDDNTLLYNTHQGWGHPSILAGFCRPNAIMSPFIDTRHPAAGRHADTRREAPHGPLVVQQTLGPVKLPKRS